MTEIRSIALSVRVALRSGMETRLCAGAALCAAVSLGAFLLERIEKILLGRTWLEPLVLAIMLGAALRNVAGLREHWLPGIAFSAKLPLELAVVLLGASVSAQTVAAAGPELLLGIAGVVVAAIASSYAMGRVLGLPFRMALLVACGNSICGNSAIATVAPLIGADGEDVAASIGFTALLGVVVVLLLPLLGMALGLSKLQFGILAGLTVYAVPQVIAAAAPLGSVAVQMGTLVKLVRVLMLGPVCMLLSLAFIQLPEKPGAFLPQVSAGARTMRSRLPVRHLVPWFIIGFLLLTGLRSADAIPTAALVPMSKAANLLTVFSMAALGLGVDGRSVAYAGARITATVILSLLVLTGISLALIAMLRFG